MTTGANQNDLLHAGAARDLAAMPNAELVELYEALAARAHEVVEETSRQIEAAISPVAAELQRRGLR